MLVMVPIIYLAMLHGVSGAHLRRRSPLKVSAVTFNAGNTWAAPALQDQASDAQNLVTTFFRTGSTGNGTTSEVNMQKFQQDRRALMGLGGDGLMKDDIVIVGLQEFGGGRGYGGELFNFHEKGYTDHHERYFSGPLCHLPGVAHYDTILHVYVKTGIKHVPYNSSTCKRFEEMLVPGLEKDKVKASAGCTIDNNVVDMKKYECGKVVNLLKFKVAEGVHFCAMNTHMSFAFAAEHRMDLIAKAMKEAKEAECHVTVFLGDFNSRLHCHDPKEENDENLDLGFAPGRSVEEFFKTTWDGGHKQQDELSQLLEGGAVQCYDKSKGHNQLNTLTNTVKTYGFQEPKVTFPPTYKLVTKKKADGIAEKKVNGVTQADRVSCEGYGGQQAMEMKEMCYGNKDGKEKHNPAWTDRIIYKAPGNVNVVKYEGRVVNNYFVTDHAAVGAKFEFDIQGDR